jgi:hypothetical protein
MHGGGVSAALARLFLFKNKERPKQGTSAQLENGDCGGTVFRTIAFGIYQPDQIFVLPQINGSTPLSRDSSFPS